MMSVNKVSRYHVAMTAINAGREVNEDVRGQAGELIQTLTRKIEDHKQYIQEHGKGE